MDQASLQSFIKTILIIVLVYYFFKFGFRLLAPYLIKKAVNKVGEKFQKQQEAYQKQQHSNPVNDFETDLKNYKTPKERKKVGEYIDFEEID